MLARYRFEDNVKAVQLYRETKDLQISEVQRTQEQIYTCITHTHFNGDDSTLCIHIAQYCVVLFVVMLGYVFSLLTIAASHKLEYENSLQDITNLCKISFTLLSFSLASTCLKCLRESNLCKWCLIKCEPMWAVPFNMFGVSMRQQEQLIGVSPTYGLDQGSSQCNAFRGSFSNFFQLYIFSPTSSPCRGVKLKQGGGTYCAHYRKSRKAGGKGF